MPARSERSPKPQGWVESTIRSWGPPKHKHLASQVPAKLRDYLIGIDPTLADQLTAAYRLDTTTTEGAGRAADSARRSQTAKHTNLARAEENYRPLPTPILSTVDLVRCENKLPPTIAELTVTPTDGSDSAATRRYRFASTATGNRTPPYIAHDRSDTALDAAIEAAFAGHQLSRSGSEALAGRANLARRVILVHGPPAAGKPGQ